MATRLRDPRLVQMSQRNPFTEESTAAIPVRTGKSPPSRKLWIGLGLVSLCGVIACSGLGWLAVQRALYTHSVADAAVEPYDMDDYGVVAESMSGSSRAVPAQDSSEIETAIQDVFDAIESGDVLDHVDADGYIAQMERSGRYRALDVFEVLQIKSDIESSMNFPEHYQHFAIHSMVPLSSDWVIVFMSTWDDGGWEYSTLQRWWMVRRDERWKLADFQDLDIGCSEAAAYAQMYTLQDDPRVDNYYDFYSEISDIYASIDEQQAVDRLDRLFETAIPPVLRDELCFDLAEAYFYMDKYDRAEAAFKRVADPQRTPGTFLGLARCAAHNGDYRSVITYTDQYLDLLGNTLALQSCGLERGRSWARAKKRSRNGRPYWPSNPKTCRPFGTWLDNYREIEQPSYRKFMPTFSMPTRSLTLLSTCSAVPTWTPWKLSPTRWR